MTIEKLEHAHVLVDKINATKTVIEFLKTINKTNAEITAESLNTLFDSIKVINDDLFSCLQNLQILYNEEFVAL